MFDSFFRWYTLSQFGHLARQLNDIHCYSRQVAMATDYPLSLTKQKEVELINSVT